jgi:hypothetical protein
MDKKDLQKKILSNFINKGLTIRNVVADDPDFDDEEKEYSSSMMIFKVEDISDKEKAIQNVLEILGELSVDSSFDDSDEIKKRIEKLQDVLIFVQS